MKTKRSRWMLLALAGLVGAIFELPLFPSKAHAIIGRPLTPFSYAGVARRTTRRAVVYGAAAHPYGYVAPAPYAVPAPYPAPYPYRPVAPYYW
jgi:hypothetical protein